LWGNGLGDIWMLNGAYFNAGFKYSGATKATAYRQGAGVSDGSHSWSVSASGTAGNAISFTQAMTLDASGKLGLGRTSISYELDISGNNGGGIRYTDNTNSVQNLFSSYNSTGLVGTLTNHPLTFWTNNAERARIDSSGNLLVGTTSTIGNAIFVTKSANSAGRFYLTSGTAGFGITEWFSDVGGTQTSRAYIRADGGLANYSANNVNLSDVRTKIEIKDAGSYLAKICAIPVRTFKYKNIENAEENLGVIAQEVETIAPELVDANGFGETPEDGVPLKAIYQTDLQYALMKALQELSAKFDAYVASHP